MLSLPLSDCRALVRILQYQYLSYEDEEANLALKKIFDFVELAESIHPQSGTVNAEKDMISTVDKIGGEDADS
jgi:hypothetical protein